MTSEPDQTIALTAPATTPAPATASISSTVTAGRYPRGYSARSAGAGRMRVAAREASALIAAVSATAATTATGYHHQAGSVRTSGPSAGSVAADHEHEDPRAEREPDECRRQRQRGAARDHDGRTWRGVAPTEASTA